MINIEKLKRELKKRYIDDRAILCNIETYKTGILKNEILIILDEPNFSIIEKFKEDAETEDIFATIDKAIYKEDYKYSYCEIKEFFKENELDKATFERVFGDSLFILQDNEIIVMLEEYVFSILCNDDEMSYKVKNLYEINLKNKSTLKFKKIDKDRLDENIQIQVLNCVIRLQTLRKEFKLKKERL